MKPYRTVLAGFGRMGAGYAADPVMTRAYPYAVHAQVLRDHQRITWDAVIDPDEEARARARADWGINVAVASIEDLPEAETYDLAILSTPPSQRVSILDGLPDLKGVMVEKPLALSEAEGRAFVAETERRGLLAQVVLQRRADPVARRLAEGEMATRVGQVQLVFATYGNGLENNGTHLIDWIRMLFGEVRSVQRIGSLPGFEEGPISGDINIAFALVMEAGFPVMVAPLRFACYRELSLDIWGTEGRVAFHQEGLTLTSWTKKPNRGLSDAHEIAADAPRVEATGNDRSLWYLYENMIEALDGTAKPLAAAWDVLGTLRLVEGLMAEAVK